MKAKQKGVTRQDQPQKSLKEHTDKGTQFSDKSALKLLYELMKAESCQRYPSNPYPLIPKRFNLHNSNDLAKAIIKMIQLHGYQANHLNPKVRFIDNSYTTTDVLGHRLRIGSGYWVNGALTNGAPIVSSTIHGISVKLEIRITASHFRQSEALKQYQHQVEQSGGLYVVVTSLADFSNWFYSFVEGGAHD